MPDQLTLDVIDRPARGVLRALLGLREAGRADLPGLRALIPLGTADFAPRIRAALTAPTPRRLGVLAVWEDDDAVEDRWRQTLAGLASSAGEHWHVRGEVTRGAFSEPWRGWTPRTSDAEELGDDEAALILVSGNLRARAIREFVPDAARSAAQAFEHPGYLGGLAVYSSPLNTTSCSAWRRYGDAKDYAFRQGRHAAAMRRDRAHENHRTEWFLRVRPLAERGTLNGAAPFASALGADRVVAGG